MSAEQTEIWMLTVYPIDPDLYPSCAGVFATEEDAWKAWETIKEIKVNRGTTWESYVWDSFSTELVAVGQVLVS